MKSVGLSCLARRAFRIGLSVSLFIHVCLLTVLFSSAHQPRQASASLSVISVSSGFSDRAQAGDQDPTVAVRVVATPSEVTGGLVGSKIDTIVARVQELPKTKQLDRLEQMGQKLQRVSSEQSLEELADKFEDWLGYQPRASEPVEQPTAAQFDYETAQLHDVLREDGPPPRYTAVLLDAQGRTLRLPIGESEGETTYQLMQRIKANPLLDRIYRRIAMPLFDQFIRAGRAATELESDARSQAVGESK